VRDAEHVREQIVPRDNHSGRWSALGQSFGGFCAASYLSLLDKPEREDAANLYYFYGFNLSLFFLSLLLLRWCVCVRGEGGAALGLPFAPASVSHRAVVWGGV
jgi:hypothetical protein